MGKVRTNNKAYRLEKHELYMTIHYALRYDEFRREYRDITDSAKAMTYDADRVVASACSDPTYRLAERRAETAKKIMNIEGSVRAAAGDVLYPYILKALTQEGANYELLHYEYKMPCGRNLFYLLKRKAYFILAKKI